MAENYTASDYIFKNGGVKVYKSTNKGKTLNNKGPDANGPQVL